MLYLELEIDFSEEIDRLLLRLILELDNLFEREALDSYDLFRSSVE